MRVAQNSRMNGQSGKDSLEKGRHYKKSYQKSQFIFMYFTGQAFEVVSKDQELMVAIGSNVTLECIVEGDDFEYINNPIVFLKGEDKHSINNNSKYSRMCD